MGNGISIVKHTIRGVGGFSEETTIKMSPRGATLLLGVNGAGKTTILNSICSLFGNFLFDVLETPDEYFHLMVSSISIGESESEVRTLFKMGQTDFPVGYNFLLNGDSRMHGTHRKIHKTFLNLHQDDNGILPIFRYFQTEKYFNEITPIQYNKIALRNIGYSGLFTKTILLNEITGFIVSQINIENQKKIDKEDLEHETLMGKYIRDTLSKFTSILYGQAVEVKVKASKYSSAQTLVVVKADQQLEFLQLSSGEKYVFGLVLELIYRAAILNPNMQNLREVPGIVLIDEIEDHLHPRWQLTILQALQTCFPNVQFIVSSHSPLIASSVRREQIVALYDFTIIPTEEIPDIYSGTANELLDKVLHSNFQIDKFQDKKREIDILINQFNFDAAEEKLNDLKTLVNANPQWIKNIERKISFAKA